LTVRNLRSDGYQKILAKKLRCGKEFIEEQRKKEGIAV
jgi:hypothetical protein